jgi:pheromone shutdown protein TraB
MNNTLSKDIIKEWGLGTLPNDKQLEMVERIGRIIYQAVLVRSLDILSEKDQNEFDDLLDQDTTTPDDVLAFLQRKIPTFEQIMLEERRNIREDLMAQV